MARRNAWSLDRPAYIATHIPAAHTVEQDAESSAVAYLYETKEGKPAAACFSGKRSAPDSRYQFGSEAARAKHVADHAAGVRRNEAFRVEQREKRKQASRAAANMEVPADGYMSAPAVAVWLRKCLAETFPGVKFSVTSDRSLRVSWVDGPAVRDVDRVANVFAGSYFDGSIDYEGSIYHRIDGREVRFGASYVFTSRELSLAAARIGAEAARAAWVAEGGANVPACLVIEQRGSGSGYVHAEANPAFGGCVEGRFPGEVELLGPVDEDGRRMSWTLGTREALGAWFDKVQRDAGAFQPQASATLQRIEIRGTDGYGMNGPAADGGEVGRGYPRPKEPAPDAEAVQAVEQARADLLADLVEQANAARREEAAQPRVVACEVIDFAPHLEAFRARADAAKPANASRVN